jgi:hypothetical protein
MQENNTRPRIALIAGLLIGGVVVYLFSQLVSNNRLVTARAQLDGEIQAQTTKLSGFATILRHSGGTTSVDAVVSDCSSVDRARFDSLLSRIESLNRTDLAELRVLFNDCADYHAKRRTGVFFQFEREVEVWKQLVSARRSLGATQTMEDRNNWQDSLELERTRMNVLNSLVRIQGDIIEALYDGESVDSLRLKNLLDESVALREQLVSRGL